MYADQDHRKQREIKIRVDQETFDLIDALARFHRTQKAVLARDLLVEALEEMEREQKAVSTKAAAA